MTAQTDPQGNAGVPAGLDQQESREWMDALSAVIDREGAEYAHKLIEDLLEHARQNSVDMPFSANTGYVNTIETSQEARCPGNLEIEGRLRAYMRWNAMAMVVKANRLHPPEGGDLGGHIGSFASLANMFAAGFNHFWHAENENHGGDCLYIQGHVSPGIYARAYLEGRISEEQLLNFRQEVDGKGLSSYPHPKLMPEFWQFPTVSMGLGPLMAIYQARFLKYLQCVLIGLPVWYIIGILVTFSDQFGQAMGIKDIDPAKAILFLYTAVAFGDFSVGWLSEYLKSRKKTFFIFVSIAIVFCVLFFLQNGGTANTFYLICAGMGFGAGFNVVYITMGVEQFGTNLRASAAISIPNMVRGSLPLILWLFKSLRTSSGDYLTGAWITGAILFALAIWAAWFMEETYGKDLDFLENN
jgi:hypothetical protein